MLFSNLYNMLRSYIASAYNMLYNLLCKIAPPLHSTPCYIAVFACYNAHCYSMCYIAPGYMASLTAI